MKKRNKLITIFAALCAVLFIIVGCGDRSSREEKPNEPVVSVSVKYDNLTIKDTEVEGYDYTYIFTIISDGKVVTVDASYIDDSAVLAAAGTYDVVCSYGGKQATAKITVKATDYTLELTRSEITLITHQVESYDFKALFIAKKDGAVQAVEDGMITTDVKATAGSYTYSVTYMGITKTLAVTVLDDVLIVPSYAVKTLQESELGTYDYTELFSLYVEGHAVKVTEAMLETSEIAGAAAGDTVEVGFSYKADEAVYTSSVRVKVVKDRSYTVSSRDIVIYPHGENVELEGLFEIKHGDEIVPVTADMISGAINYSEAGEYEITLNAFGEQAKAIVKVETGAIVTAVSDTVFVRKGTDKDGYAFSCDFKVIINGIEFFAIPDGFFVGTDEADFSTVGDYDVTLRVPYNTKPLGLSGVPDFEYAECTITYSVREQIGTAQAVSPLVEVKRGAGEFDVFDNVLATLNGRKIGLTDNPEWVSVLAVYADVKSEAIDMDTTELQHVEIDVYANGVDARPITVEYDVRVSDDVTITVIEKSVFTGETLYTTDLFEVTRNGAPVDVTADMVSGKVDTFTPGIYEVTCELGGVSAIASVTVFDRNIMGTYKTLMTEIPTSSDDEYDDPYGDYGDYYEDWYGEGEYYSLYSGSSANSTGRATQTVLKDAVLGENGNISVNGMPATLIGGKDEKTLLIRFGNNDYTLHYDDGIVVLDPDNSIKLTFSDRKRPLVYFNSDIWEITGAITINYGSEYVLSGTTTTYSIDAFRIVKKDDGAEMWYGLYVELAERNNGGADTLYNVRWGEATFDGVFTPQAGASSTLELCGVGYKFTMESASIGKIDRDDGTASKFAGKSFGGTIDGKPARLDVATNGNYSFFIDGEEYFSFGMYDKSNNKNWYEDGDTVFLYKHGEMNFSYKFKLDTRDNTFTISERDRYYGKYESNGKYIYLDGYGTGLLADTPGSHATVSFEYAVNADVLTVTYRRTKPSFKHGASSEFYIGEFLNTLKVKRFDTDLFDGELLVNSIITDGAIVSVNRTRFGAPIGNESVDRIKSEIRKSVKIVTKDGEVSDADKADRNKNGYIDVSAISATNAGYYRFSVSITVSGEKVISYYTVQIVKGGLDVGRLLGSYKGVSFSGYDLAVDGNAQITLTAVGTEYIGYVTAAEDGFKFKAYSKNGGSIYGSLNEIAENAVVLSVNGAVNFEDYYIKVGYGSSRVAGITGTALREIAMNDGQTLYILTSSATATGEIVELTSLDGGVDNGCTVKLEKADGTVKYIRILKWGDTKEGIEVLADYTE